MTGKALITGASRGIGKAIAYRLASEGYNLVLTCVKNIEKLQDIADDLSSQYKISCEAVLCDAGDPQSVDLLFDSHEDIDVLINNAGISYIGLLQDMSVEEWNRVINTNMNSAFYTSRRAIGPMIRRQSGRIINISSTNGINTYYPMSIDYDASKAALNSLTHNLAIQYAPDIHVNAIAPGFIGTESELQGYDEQFLKQEQEKILLQRYGEPEEVANLVNFLISDEANYINNSIIRIDGGQLGA